MSACVLWFGEEEGHSLAHLAQTTTWCERTAVLSKTFTHCVISFCAAKESPQPIVLFSTTYLPSQPPFFFLIGPGLDLKLHPWVRSSRNSMKVLTARTDVSYLRDYKTGGEEGYAGCFAFRIFMIQQPCPFFTLPCRAVVFVLGMRDSPPGPQGAQCPCPFPMQSYTLAGYINAGPWLPHATIDAYNIGFWGIFFTENGPHLSGHRGSYFPKFKWSKILYDPSLFVGTFSRCPLSVYSLLCCSLCVSNTLSQHTQIQSKCTSLSPSMFLDVLLLTIATPLHVTKGPTSRGFRERGWRGERSEVGGCGLWVGREGPFSRQFLERFLKRTAGLLSSTPHHHTQRSEHKTTTKTWT